MIVFVITVNSNNNHLLNSSFWYSMFQRSLYLINHHSHNYHRELNMKYLVALIFVCLLSFNINSQDTGKIKLSESSEIESTIEFLEDSQRVQETVRSLRKLLEVQNMTAKPDPEAVALNSEMGIALNNENTSKRGLYRIIDKLKGVPFLRNGVYLLIIFIVTIILLQITNMLVKRFKKIAIDRMLESGRSSQVEVEKRAATLSEIIKKISTISIIIMAVLVALDQIGFDIKAMLAGVGIIGVAVGFGAQNLVKDIISGLFVIFENRIRVGDVAIINGTGGYVEQVNLRTTVLRSLDGTVHVFPNGSITSLSNMTHEFSFYVFDIRVNYKEDTDKIVSILKDVSDEMIKDPAYKKSILEPLEVLGVDSFNDSAVIVKARIKTVPIMQWVVGREMNRRIKKRFDILGIEIPFPHRSLFFGENSKPISLKVDGLSDREQIKALIRETLTENNDLMNQEK